MIGLTLYILLVTWCTNRFNIKKFYALSKLLCHLQHRQIGFYNRDEKCLQRGPDWVFKYSSLRLVFKMISEQNNINFNLLKPTGYVMHEPV